jgi:glycosyltransferase involved in cell wall biosynthesis
VDKHNRVLNQFHYTASAADAVTHHMLWIRATLKEAGIGGEIFVGRNQAPASYGILPFEKTQVNKGEGLLLHHSHGNPLLAALLRTHTRKALVYHNITPEVFFPHDPHLAAFSYEGRKQIADYSSHVERAFGVSRFNCRELELAGFSSPEVFPLLDLSPTAERVRSAPLPTPSKTHDLIFVGKQTPHKNQALLIRALFYLQAASPGKYRLLLVGRGDPLYSEYLRLLAKKLGLAEQVIFTGPVSSPRLESLYLSASALVCTSLHEGFCVPLVEAMQRQLPVFALPSAGIRETLGTAGVRLAAPNPLKIAEAVDTVLSDPSAVHTILEGQELRLAELSQVHNPTRLVQLCEAFLEEGLLSSPKVSAPEVYV